jgi:CheY-like chemotaxis protein
MPHPSRIARPTLLKIVIRCRADNSISEQRYLFVREGNLHQLVNPRKGHETCCLHRWSQWDGTVSCHTTGAARTARIWPSITMNHAVRHRRRVTQTPSGSSEDRGTFSREGNVAQLQEATEPSRRKLAKTQPRAQILVIEDDPYAREALSLLLDFYGYDVTCASNGADGLALVTEATPDLVVTDWRMPGLSGLALCRALRERRDAIPIIVVTSAEEVFSHDQPVNARLRKPIDPRLLNHTITRELRALRRR